MRNLLALLFLASLPALAADFGGSWKGTMKVKTSDGAIVQQGGAFLELKQNGSSVTGRAGTDEDTLELINGKAEGSTLSFSVSTDDGVIPVKLTLTEGGELAGSATTQMDGNKVVAELRFKRQ